MQVLSLAKQFNNEFESYIIIVFYTWKLFHIQIIENAVSVFKAIINFMYIKFSHALWYIIHRTTMDTISVTKYRVQYQTVTRKCCPNCVHGTCTSPGTPGACTCSPGWTGSTCNEGNIYSVNYCMVVDPGVKREVYYNCMMHCAVQKCKLIIFIQSGMYIQIS